MLIILAMKGYLKILRYPLNVRFLTIHSRFFCSDGHEQKTTSVVRVACRRLRSMVKGRFEVNYLASQG